MTHVWTLVATCLLLSSSFATFLTTLHLRCRWDVHASSVRWLFWFMFLCVCSWCSLRAIFFMWMSTRQRIEIADGEEDVRVPRYTSNQLDRLGIHGILYLKDAKKAWITALLCLGNVALFGIAVTLFPLTYELWRLARKSMDRGLQGERAKLRSYAVGIGGSLTAYAATQLVLALVYGGYNLHIHRCLLGVYILQFIGLVFMASRLLMLKFNGRKFETIQGTFVMSPVYQRLKAIMLVYAVFVFQFQLSMLIIYIHNVAPDDQMINFISVSMMVYNTSGLALAITTSCSQACVFSTCAPCLPEAFEAEFLHQRFSVPTDEDLEAPRTNPVFVYTDIQSSTALWNKNGSAMSAAIDLHDTILRSALLKHRGYEITTVGDAFQVAFRTIRDAVEYCMDVQLQLLAAKWPKEIHGLIPATVKERVRRRVIFSGLRVRMGIHDASEAEGRLVQDVHVVTGKTTYTGMSEIVAEFVGELGTGGQVLLTERVATWLKHHREELSVDLFMDYVGEYTVPQVNTHVEIYQLQPAMLAARTRTFKKPEHEIILTVSDTKAPGLRTDDMATIRQPLGAIVEGTDDEKEACIEMASPTTVSYALSPTECTYQSIRTPRQDVKSPHRNWMYPHQQLTISA